MDAQPDLPTLFRQFLATGPSILLADGRHPGHSGLPVGTTADILRVDFAANDETTLADDPGHLVVQYVNETVTATARLAWDACFFLAGQTAAELNTNEMVTRISSRLPECLEPDRLTNLRRMLGAMGLGAPEQEWKLDVRPALLAEDADRSLWCEDKREAVQRILARPGTPAVLWFMPGAPGVMLPAGTKASDQAELLVGAAVGSHDVQVTQFAVAWSVDTPRGRQRVTLPWRAIGAIRDARTGEGWWWPRDLPPGPRADFQTDAVLWTVLQRLGGIPLAPMSPGPARKMHIVVLQRPLSDHKPTALRQLLSQGTTVVLADPAVPGVRLPPSLPGPARLLMVPLLLPGLDPKLRLDDEGFGSQSPDYEGVVHDTWLPWDAVFLMAGGNGSAPHTWPAAFPEFLVAAQHALRAVQHSDGGALPPELDAFDHKPTGDGLGLGLTVGPDGRHVLVVGRPLGVVPPPPGAPPGQIFRSTMELSFRLPPPLVQ